jgi:hypothetical protein
MTSWHPGDRDYPDLSILRIPSKPPAQRGMTKGFEHCSSEKNPGSRSPWCCLIFRRTSQVAAAKPGFHQWLLKVQGQPSGSLQIAAQHEDLMKNDSGGGSFYFNHTMCPRLGETPIQDWGRLQPYRLTFTDPNCWWWHPTKIWSDWMPRLKIVGWFTPWIGALK